MAIYDIQSEKTKVTSKSLNFTDRKCVNNNFTIKN